MRIVAEVPHPVYKITILHHMNRYTVQIEANATSQSYMLRESDNIQSAEDVKQLITPHFLQRIDKSFLDLGDNLMQLLASGEDENTAEEGRIIEGII